MAERNEEPLQLGALTHLDALSRIDTLYRDRYLNRIRAALGHRLPETSYRNYQLQHSHLGNLPNQIRNAMNSEA